MRSLVGRLLLVFCACIATAGLAQTRGKPVVAVKEMTDLANTGQVAAFSTMIQSAIASTGKFRVIERSLGAIASEQQLARRGMVTTNNPRRVGGVEGADFLIYGTITSASGGRQADEGSNTGRAILGKMLGMNMGNGGCSRAVATLAIDIKIVDGKTGELRYNKSLDRASATKTSCSGNPQIDIATLLRGAADEIAKGLVTTIYPIQVADVQADGTFFLNYGSGTLTPGMIMAVYGKGRKIVDPTNGDVLSEEGPLLGTIRITEVTQRFSKGVAVAPFASPPPTGSVVREAPPPPPPAKGRRR